ncbi:hypothetical protein [Tardiphaga sp. 11_C7_N12_6]|uniref:hypothetical protein n=1 Tax=Tardiphaga sp. 11_C7_N12_6 TaxID=3240789 RepID=UPI003F27280C
MTQGQGDLIIWVIVIVYLGVALFPGLFLGGMIGVFVEDGQTGFLTSIVSSPICAGVFYFFTAKQEKTFQIYGAMAAALTATTLLGFWLGRKIRG